MTKSHERLAVFVFGIIFITALLVLAVAFPKPTPWQYRVFAVVLALAAAGVASMIPGSLEVSLSKWLKAGGAIAVFVLVYYKSPVDLIAAPSSKMGPLEYKTNRQGNDFSLTPFLLASPEECQAMCSDNDACVAMTFVQRPDNFGGGDCWLKKAPGDPTSVANMVSAVKVSR